MRISRPGSGTSTRTPTWADAGSAVRATNVAAAMDLPMVFSMSASFVGLQAARRTLPGTTPCRCRASRAASRSLLDLDGLLAAAVRDGDHDSDARGDDDPDRRPAGADA